MRQHSINLFLHDGSAKACLACPVVASPQSESTCTYLTRMCKCPSLTVQLQAPLWGEPLAAARQTGQYLGLTLVLTDNYSIRTAETTRDVYVTFAAVDEVPVHLAAARLNRFVDELHNRICLQQATTISATQGPKTKLCAAVS